MIKKRFEIIKDHFEVVLWNDGRIKILIDGEYFGVSIVMEDLMNEIEKALLLDDYYGLKQDFLSTSVDNTLKDPETRFLAHCSDLRAWVEDNFNTKTLRTNLSFPILKKLIKVGAVDIQVLKDEVVKRFKEEEDDLFKDFLIEHNYLKILSRQEFWDILPQECEVLQKIEMELNSIFILYPSIVEEENLAEIEKVDNQLGFSMKENKVFYVSFYLHNKLQNKLSQLFDMLNDLKFKRLLLNYNSLSELPKNIDLLSFLEMLGLSNNPLKLLPDTIGNLTSLQHLDLSDTDLKELPESFAKLTALVSLDISSTKLTNIPNSIGNLRSIKYLNLSNTDLEELPESIAKLSSLQSLWIQNTKIDKIPDEIRRMKSLLILK